MNQLEKSAIGEHILGNVNHDLFSGTAVLATVQIHFPHLHREMLKIYKHGDWRMTGRKKMCQLMLLGCQLYM